MPQEETSSPTASTASQSSASSTSSAPPLECSWTIEGMDCGSCAVKIRTAVEKMPGVSNVQVSTMSETLSITLDQEQTDKDDVARQVTRLGYGVTDSRDSGSSRAAGQDPAASASEKASLHENSEHAHAPPDSHDQARAHDVPADARRRWYRSKKGRLVLMAGAMLLAAWGSKYLIGESASYWAFIAATMIGVIPVARRAWAALMAGIPFTIEMLMTIAASGAVVIGAVEEAALVVFLFAVGEVLEGVAADQARASIKALTKLVPKSAFVIEDGAVKQVDAALLDIGQTILVRPGDRIPTDGIIISGISGIDESAVTGESVPVTKTVDDPVYAGSINAEAALHVRVEKAAQDNTISRIIRLVEQAQDARAPTERFIDRFSRYYMPAIVGLALVVALVPPVAFGAPWDIWIYRALALLLIGCPCALVISVPASIASALSAGARRGLLMKGGAVIEAVASIEKIAFDKTGTLTAGRPFVTDVVPFDVTEEELLSIAAAIETGSSHPLAEAITRYSVDKGIGAAQVSAIRNIPGRGVTAEIDGTQVAIGSAGYADELGALQAPARSVATKLEAAGKTVAALMREGRTIGLIALRDEPREDAAGAISRLKALKIRAIMLTGDNKRSAKAIAADLVMDFKAGLMPADKVAAVQELNASNRLMMVGDGINDAPALAAATVGVAMGSGTDVALETADAALLRNRVGDVVNMIVLSRAAMTNIRQNIAIALGLKAVLLTTSILGLTGLWMAIMADTGATVLVTLNALRLLRFSPGQHEG